MIRFLILLFVVAALVGLGKNADERKLYALFNCPTPVAAKHVTAW